jgi:pSer/pThr/pTyr-binding forkhead associated (FHA) protein/tetratricopeptide (TPR) repeat protein
MDWDTQEVLAARAIVPHLPTLLGERANDVRVELEWLLSAWDRYRKLSIAHRIVRLLADYPATQEWMRDFSRLSGTASFSSEPQAERGPHAQAPSTQRLPPSPPSAAGSDSGWQAERGTDARAAPVAEGSPPRAGTGAPAGPADAAPTREAALNLEVRTQSSDYQLQAGTIYRIGRDPKSDIVTADSRVSWRHGILRVDGDGWIFEDLGSTNGTFLGLQRLKRIEISADCVVRLGNPEDGPVFRCMPRVPAAAVTGGAATALDDHSGAAVSVSPASQTPAPSASEASQPPEPPRSDPGTWWEQSAPRSSASPPVATDDAADVPACQTQESAGPSEGERRRGRFGSVVVWLIVAGALLVLGFAPVSRLAAHGLPRAPGSSVAVVTGSQHGNTTAIQAVPIGLPNDARIRTEADVFPYAVAALGKQKAQALMALLDAKSFLADTLVQSNTPDSYGLSYPYRYPPLDAVLDNAPPASFASGATALGAALTVLAAQPQNKQNNLNSQVTPIDNAGPAAYAVLNRARAAGGCAPQLDLLLLVAANQYTRAGILAQEEQRTEAACPRDPTPAWLVGQSQLRTPGVTLSPTTVDAEVVAGLQASGTTFSHLAAEYPHDAGVLTGLGDSYLRTGTYLRSSEPFTAREDFRSAIAAYNRASALGGERDAAPGVARALVGLGEPAAAARLLSPLAASSPFTGQLLELLVTADEAAHDFRQAATGAQRLGQLGSASYPDGDALIPVPGPGFGSDSLDEVTFPLSFGAGRLTPLSTELVLPGGAGGSVQDLSFIPTYRDDTGVTGTQPGCPSWTWTRDELLLGHAALALANWPTQFASVEPVYAYSYPYCNQSDRLKLIAEAQAGQQPDQGVMKKDGITSDDIADGWQNLLRWAGNLPAAKNFAKQWQAARGDNSALPALRLGEIDFLTHQDNDAAAEFGLAARRWHLVDYNDGLDPDQAELDRGAALLAAGRAAEAVQTLRPLDLEGTQGYSYQNSPSGGNSDWALEFATVSYYACEQLADYESQSGNLHAATEDYTNALDWAPQLENRSGVGLRPEVLDNNAALAYLGLGETSTAATLESKALAADPENPVFLMTAGFIADRAGQVAQAARYDRAALDSDPGAFPAANDLGVELTREHQGGTAADALRQAVGASPDYALGWFNLGVVESQLGPSHLLAAQGAFAKAYSLDPALQNRKYEMTIDASVYRTALDLSKPLPPRWSIAQLQQPVPAAAAGLLALVVLGLGLAKATGHGGSALAAQWLDPLTDRLQSAPVLRRLHAPGWSLAATAASFLLTYLRRGADPAEVVAYIAGVLVLAFLAVGARVFLARSRHVTITQDTWPPGLAFGLVTGAFGLPWAPLPVVRADGEDSVKIKVHLAAPITLAVLSALLFLESAWLHTPVTESWAVAALIMSASTLLPVGPLDGAQLGKAGILAATGVLGGALLVGLGLI